MTRTLIIVNQVNPAKQTFLATLISANQNRFIGFRFRDLPRGMQPLIQEKKRFHAMVNIHESRADRMRFRNWEPA